MSDSKIQLPHMLRQRFEKIEVLGEGDHSRVYAAEQNGQAVILKVLQLGQMTDWKLLQLFEREARALMHLQHPRIPRFLDFVADHERFSYTLITERVPGQPLSVLLDQGWQVREQDVLEIAAQALQILAYLHAFQPPLIHRDLKPSNFIWDSASSKLYLIDFGGIQERLYAHGSAGSTVIGTFGYMAPEQFAGRTEIRSDLYSLGATLIHLLTGRSPAQLTKKNSPELQFQNYLMCSPQLSRWLGTLVHPTLQQRPASAQAALETLQAELKLDIQAFEKLPAPSPHQVLPELQASTQELSDLRPQALPQLSNYRWLEDLAKGGQTRVWLAQGPEEAPIVVKSLYLANAANWKSLDMFQREMRTLQQLNHPRIPQFLGIKQDEDKQVWHLLFERMPGTNLRQQLTAGWRPSEDSLWNLAEQGLNILDYLHQQDPPIFHRDIKPSNLMRDERGELYLIDFGAVQQPFRAQGAGGSTVIGSYGYMAPEQFSGQAYAATDLYGLGVTLCELASRCPAEQMPREGLELKLDQFLQLSPELTQWLQSLVHSDLARRAPNVATARQRLQALKAQRQDRELRATSQALHKKVRARSLPIGLQVVLVLSLTLGLSYALSAHPPSWMHRQELQAPIQGQIVQLASQETQYTQGGQQVSARRNRNDFRGFHWLRVAPGHRGWRYFPTHQGSLWGVSLSPTRTFNRNSTVELIEPGTPTHIRRWQFKDLRLLDAAADTQGNLWLVGEENLWLYHHSGKKWIQWPLPASWSSVAKSKKIARLFHRHGSEMLLFQKEHWYRVTPPSSLNQLPAPFERVVSEGLPRKPQFRAVERAYDGSFFQLEHHKGEGLKLYRYRGQTGDVTSFKTSPKDHKLSRHHCLVPLHQERVGWLNQEQYWRLDLKTQHASVLPKDYRCREVIPLGKSELLLTQLFYDNSVTLLDGPYAYTWKTQPRLGQLYLDEQSVWGLSGSDILRGSLEQFLIQVQK